MRNMAKKKENLYMEKAVKPLIEYLKAVWKLDDKDKWLIDFKKTLSSAIDKAYSDGFQDGADEGGN